jgi:hypothetical protein
MNGVAPPNADFPVSIDGGFGDLGIRKCLFEYPEVPVVAPVVVECAEFRDHFKARDRSSTSQTSEALDESMPTGMRCIHCVSVLIPSSPLFNKA